MQRLSACRLLFHAYRFAAKAFLRQTVTRVSRAANSRTRTPTQPAGLCGAASMHQPAVTHPANRQINHIEQRRTLMQAPCACFWRLLAGRA